MLTHVINFVYGNITIENKTSDELTLSDDNNTITIKVGDEIIWANNSINQAWINSGIITKIENDSNRILVDDSISMAVGGLAYLGILNKG